MVDISRGLFSKMIHVNTGIPDNTCKYTMMRTGNSFMLNMFSGKLGLPM